VLSALLEKILQKTRHAAAHL